MPSPSPGAKGNTDLILRTGTDTSVKVAVSTGLLRSNLIRCDKAGVTEVAIGHPYGGSDSSRKRLTATNPKIL
jgi:hypothetical protein